MTKSTLFNIAWTQKERNTHCSTLNSMLSRSPLSAQGFMGQIVHGLSQLYIAPEKNSISMADLHNVMASC